MSLAEQFLILMKSTFSNFSFMNVLLMNVLFLSKKLLPKLGFPAGPMVKNLPANAGDTDLILDPGRSYMLWSN